MVDRDDRDFVKDCIYAIAYGVFEGLTFIARVTIAVALSAAVTALIGWLLSLAWNAAIAAAFGLPTLLWWQGWIIWLLLLTISNLFRSSK